MTPTLAEEFNNCFQETRYTQEIQFMKWPTDTSLYTSLQQSCHTDVILDEVKDRYGDMKAEDTQEMAVEVR